MAQHDPAGTYNPVRYGLARTVGPWGQWVDYKAVEELGFTADTLRYISFGMLSRLWQEEINNRRHDWLGRHPRFLVGA